MPSLRDLERAAKHIPNAAKREEMLRDIAALRKAKGEHRKLVTLIKEKGKEER